MLRKFNLNTFNFSKYLNANQGFRVDKNSYVQTRKNMLKGIFSSTTGNDKINAITRIAFNFLLTIVIFGKFYLDEKAHIQVPNERETGG